MKMNFSHFLTLLFVYAKLVGWIDWSWWLVFWPMYIVMILVAINHVMEDKP